MYFNSQPNGVKKGKISIISLEQLINVIFKTLFLNIQIGR